jgi:hypothetical protein
MKSVIPNRFSGEEPAFCMFPEIHDKSGFLRPEGFRNDNIISGFSIGAYGG